MAHPPHPRPPLPVLPSLSALRGWAPGTQLFGMRSALGGGLPGRVSARAGGISAARPVLGGGRAINLPGGNGLKPWETEHSRGHRHPDPGPGGGQVTWSPVPEGLRRPSSLGRSQASGKWREDRAAGLLANYLPTPPPSAPLTVGDGGRGSLRGSRADAEGGVSSEIGRSGTRVRVMCLPPYPPLPLCHPSSSSAARGPRAERAGGARARTSSMRKPRGMRGRVGLWRAGPTSSPSRALRSSLGVLRDPAGAANPSSLAFSFHPKSRNVAQSTADRVPISTGTLSFTTSPTSQLVPLVYLLSSPSPPTFPFPSWPP